MQTVNHSPHSSLILMRSPGRIRVKVPGLYRRESEKKRLESQLAQQERILAVHANPLTGNMLILFDIALPESTILVMLGLSVKPASEDVLPTQERRSNKQRFSARPISQKSGKPTQNIYPSWHLRDAAGVLAYYKTSSKTGLLSQEAQDRLQHGRNVLPQKHARSSSDILLSQFSNLPTLLLGVSAGLSLLTGGIVEAIAIAAVVSLNAGIGFFTERRAEQTIASLSELIDDVIPVLRDASTLAIAASQVVPGDMLILAPGVRIAGDARVIQSNGLCVDESALTGESHFVLKQDTVLEREAALADRCNMVYMGTAVTAGHGLAVVVGTGINTEIGAIQSLMNATDLPKTPLQKQLDQLGNRCVTISLGICAGVFALGILRGRGLMPMLKAAVSLAVAAVPEGLPTVATTSLARGIRLMREQDMLVRRLHAVETLGAIHTICLDKTGTLTMNRMSVITIQTSMRMYENGGKDGHDLAMQSDRDHGLSRLLTTCVLSNEVSIQNGGYSPDVLSSSSSSFFNGSATENALIQLAVDAGLPVEKIRQRFPVIQSELRAEGRNYMKSVHVDNDTGRYIVAIKGSPEEVIALCSHYESENGMVAVDDVLREQVIAQNRAMAQRQLRVLGFAYLEAENEVDIDTVHPVWLGLVGLADPLRPGLKSVIKKLHEAGIRTTMITGDQPATARAIGETLGLAGKRSLRIAESEVIETGRSGKDMSELSDTHIFARVSPARKLQIVQALQQQEEVVAMTGDGINDGPALQAADVGIAMGLHGTDLARSAADVVLKDDRLETILDAIRQGRTISANIEKSVHFLLASNLSEILVVLGAAAIGNHAPLSSVQLLWINLLSDVLPAVALAAESAESDIMQRPPRETGKSLIGDEELKRYAAEGAVISGGALVSYLYGILRYGAGGRASTLAFNSLVLGQLLHALFCRSDRQSVFSRKTALGNNRLNLAVGGSIALQAFANFFPGLRRLLGMTGIGMADIAVLMAGAGIPLLVNEATKARRNREEKSVVDKQGDIRERKQSRERAFLSVPL